MKKTLLLLCFLLLLAASSSALADTAGPSIVLKGRGELLWPCGRPFTDPGYRAYGADGEDRSEDVRTEGRVTVWRVGEYTLRYTLSDGDTELASAERLVRVVPQHLPETVQPPNGTICLTFDDGPCPYTAEVLDILAKYGVKATFFIVGSQTKYLDILPRILAEGHTIGIHCNDHLGMGWIYKNEENYFSDLMAVQELIHDKTGTYAHVLRFPGGGRTASYLAGTLDGGYQELYAMLADLGIRAYDWNVQPESADKTTESIITEFTHPSAPYDYAVVLQHDTRYFSVMALEQMIEWALNEGYTFSALNESFPEVHFYD